MLGGVGGGGRWRKVEEGGGGRWREVEVEEGGAERCGKWRREVWREGQKQTLCWKVGAEIDYDII